MQTAHALRLVETGRRPVRRRAASRPRLERRHARGARTKPRCPAPAKRDRGGWLKPLVMAIIVAGEWLVMAAQVFVQFYVI